MIPPCLSPHEGTVGHEHQGADDALQPLLKQRLEPGLTECHGVQDYLIIKLIHSLIQLTDAPLAFGFISGLE